MAFLLLAVLGFLLTHSIPALPRLRAALIAGLGWRGYLVGYSLLSLASLAWVAWAYHQAPYWPLWDYQPATRWVPVLVMPVVCCLWAIGFAVPNPFSLSLWRDKAPPCGPVGLFALLRHPVLWGFFLWALAHMTANEDAASLLMFGLFAVLSLAGMIALDAKRRRQWGPERWQHAWAARQPRRWPCRQLFALLAGVVLYGALFHLHEKIIGVSPLPPGL